MRRAVLLVDHGSRLAEANTVLEEMGQRVQGRLPDCIVRVAHMELCSPSVAQGIGACLEAGAREIIVHPYFLVPGAHSTRDIPAQVAEALASRPEVRFRVTEPLGAHPLLVDVVLDRIRPAAPGSGGPA